MMEQFFGNKIYCGTYSFMNMVQRRDIDMDLFEISTSVPFGIVHKRYPKYDHLLTPFCNPNKGLDGAIEYWGYHLWKEDADSPDALIRIMEQSMLPGDRVMLGPVDMGHLFYQPLVNLYRKLDHFIVVLFLGGKTYSITDSEGIIENVCDTDQLRKSLSVVEIPEAEGKYTIRRAKKVREVNEEAIVRYSLVRARSNFASALKDTDGINAFEMCARYLENAPCSQWGIALLYDLSYLMQRKLLHSQLLDYAKKNGLISDICYLETRRIIERQNSRLGEIFADIKRDNRCRIQAFIEMDALERKLGDCFQRE